MNEVAVPFKTNVNIAYYDLTYLATMVYNYKD